MCSYTSILNFFEDQWILLNNCENSREEKDGTATPYLHIHNQFISANTQNDCLVSYSIPYSMQLSCYYVISKQKKYQFQHHLHSIITNYSSEFDIR